MPSGLKVRGIYATALTRFFVDHRVAIADPSPEIRERFQGDEKIKLAEAVGVEIRDRPDRQGIGVEGDPAKVERVCRLIRQHFFDAVLRPVPDAERRAVEIEFPDPAKRALDEIRNRVIPTVPNHHRLKIIASEYVDLMEKVQLSGHPETREAVGRNLEEELVWKALEKGEELAIEHVKADGRVILLSEGEILGREPAERRLLLQRRKFKGRSLYDGLNVSKEAGDYAITEAKEGGWFYKHTYCRLHGEPIGEYYNVNTPIEFYPDRIRYVDLEIDVLRWTEGRVEIVEEELLGRQLDLGYLSRELAEKARWVAEELREGLLR